ncbi:hypothetical protein HGB07_09120, partial [Candidatus Roizmanbacteria bacterium]|nr:hypothetical protein [Candidatus Roizmanbacteria bacterium]
MGKRWTKKELDSLLETLKKHDNLFDVAREHAEKWSNNRSYKSITMYLFSHGYSCGGEYLNKPDLDKKTDSLEENIKKLKGKSVEEICNKLDVSPKRVVEKIKELTKKGFQLDIVDGKILIDNVQRYDTRPVTKTLKLKPSVGEIKIGVMSDLHFGSTNSLPEYVVDFVEYCYSIGIRNILIPGDLAQGIKMYKGWQNELLY